MKKRKGGAPRPAIVVIHGGGWIEGDKSSFASRSMAYPAISSISPLSDLSPSRSITGSLPKLLSRPRSKTASARSGGYVPTRKSTMSTRTTSVRSAIRPAAIWRCCWA